MTSWFLLPISTCGSCSGQGFRFYGDAGWKIEGGTYGGKDPPIFGCKIAKLGSVQSHGLYDDVNFRPELWVGNVLA